MYIVENTQEYTISGVWGSAPHPKSNSSPPTEPNHTALIQPCSEAPCGWGGMTGPWAACSSQARGGVVQFLVPGLLFFCIAEGGIFPTVSIVLVHQRLPGTARLPETPPEFPEPVLLVCHSPDSLAPRPARSERRRPLVLMPPNTQKYTQFYTQFGPSLIHNLPNPSKRADDSSFSNGKTFEQPHFFPTTTRACGRNSLHLPQIMPQPPKRFALENAGILPTSECNF